ncbi:MAG: ornithine cyclodeaminase family protein [Candidatus Latescibacterota bacterium]|nr:ornithine cyclodeaminase family protein [Candidatus Latescibacterota bacterium]
MIYLNRNDVISLLDMPACIESTRSAFEAVASGEVQSPQRTVIRMEDRPGFFGSMPIYAPGYGSAAKVMTIYPGNRDVGLESHQGFITLFEVEHGAPVALIEAGSITELRTAAVSGLATDLLGNPGESVLCILGSGVQARSHVKAIKCVRDLSRIQVWSRTPAHADDFGEWAREETGQSVVVCETAEDALKQANIVCTVTSAKEPIVARGWVAEGCHLNVVGSFTPNARELDTETIASSRLFVDSRESALNESGDIVIPKEEGTIDDAHIVAELCDLVTGQVSGRDLKEEVTVFKSLGLAVEDLVAAKAVYDRAVGAGVGTVISER